MTIEVKVPERFSFPSRAGIASGKPVRGVHAAPLADAMNYLRGHARVLLPATRFEYALPSSTTHTYTLPMQLASWMRHLEWRVQFYVSSGDATIIFTDPSGGTTTHRTVSVVAKESPYVGHSTHLEAITPGTDTGYAAPARTVTFQRTDAGAGDVYVWLLSCSSLSRRALECTAGDKGIDPPTVRTDGVIATEGFPLDGEPTFGSLGGIAQSMADQDDPTGHGYHDRHLFTWARPQGHGVAVGSSWADLFGEGPVVQASHRYIGETMRRVYCMATGKVDTSGDTLEVRFTAASGDTVTVTTTATSSGTWSVAGTLDVLAEDLATTDGLRGGDEEIVTISARVTGAGTQTGSIEGVFIYESREAV